MGSTTAASAQSQSGGDTTGGSGDGLRTGDGSGDGGEPGEATTSIGMMGRRLTIRGFCPFGTCRIGPRCCMVVFGGPNRGFFCPPRC